MGALDPAHSQQPRSWHKSFRMATQTDRSAAETLSLQDVATLSLQASCVLTLRAFLVQSSFSSLESPLEPTGDLGTTPAFHFSLLATFISNRDVVIDEGVFSRLYPRVHMHNGFVVSTLGGELRDDRVPRSLVLPTLMGAKRPLQNIESPSGRFRQTTTSRADLVAGVTPRRMIHQISLQLMTTMGNHSKLSCRTWLKNTQVQ